MNRIIISSFMLFFVICLYGQEKINIAIFETQGTAQAAKREELKNALVDAAANNPQYRVLERSVIQQVMKEQGLQMSDAFDESQAVEVGKLSGAKYILVSSINSANDYEYRIVYRLVDVATGEALQSERVRTKEIDFYETIDKIAQSKLFANEKQDNSSGASVCGCEIQKQDLPDDAKIPSGWRLPTLAELKCMCENKDKIGGFNAGVYQSKTKSEGYNVGIKFRFCEEVYVSGSFSVRCVRTIVDKSTDVSSENKKERRRPPLPPFLRRKE